jgi:AcrR family transcriptional regulator
LNATPDAAIAPRNVATRRRGKATREILLTSAIRLVALHGYAATTTQAVIDAAGVSRGSLLHQFPTRDLLMVAIAEEAMARMLAAVEDALLVHDDALAGMIDFPDILWRVQNDLPARAFSEIQLASRWDEGLEQGLRRAVRSATTLTSGKVRQFAAQYAIRDLPGLLQEYYLLIAATQGLAIGRDLTGDETLATAARALLKARFAAALQARLPDAP